MNKRQGSEQMGQERVEIEVKKTIMRMKLEMQQR